MFVVASTIGLSVLQRQREVALLRAVAATPKQVRRMIRWETLVVALLASAVGIVPGALLAHVLGGALSDRGIAPEDMEVAVGAIPVIAAVASTVVTALIAVAAAGRKAARVRPTLALQESAAEPRLIGPVRLILGVLATAGAFGVLAVAAASGDATSTADLAVLTSLVLVVAIALLGPLVARIAATILALVLGRTRNAPGFLAVSNMRTSSRRFASAMTPIVLTVAISATLVFTATTREHETAKQERDRVTADLVIQSDGAGVPRSALAEVRRTPGVATAVGTAETSLGPTLGSVYSLAQAQVADPQGLGRVLDLDVSDGSLAKLGAGSIALSKTQAETANAQVGDRVDLVLGDGTHRQVEVAAVYEHGLGFGDAVLPTALAAGHVTNPMLSQILVRTSAGVPPAQVASRLERLTASYPDVTVNDRGHHAARVDANRESNNWLFRILSVIIFLFTAIAVANTLTMIALHRTRELSLLRLVGGTRRQVLAMARWEGGMVVGLGVGLGALIALTTLVPTSKVMTGSYVPYAPIGLVVLVLGASAAVGLHRHAVLDQARAAAPPGRRDRPARLVARRRASETRGLGLAWAAHVRRRAARHRPDRGVRGLEHPPDGPDGSLAPIAGRSGLNRWLYDKWGNRGNALTRRWGACSRSGSPDCSRGRSTSRSSSRPSARPRSSSSRRRWPRSRASATRSSATPSARPSRSSGSSVFGLVGDPSAISDRASPQTGSRAWRCRLRSPAGSCGCCAQRTRRRAPRP